jgi:hypothetical protein
MGPMPPSINDQRKGPRMIREGKTEMNSEYDSYTAVTFLMVGLGVGALLALVLAPENRNFHAARSRRLEQSPLPGQGRTTA